MDTLKRGGEMSMKIRSKKLTTCRVATDGTNVGLEFLDQSGGTVTVEFRWIRPKRSS